MAGWWLLRGACGQDEVMHALSMVADKGPEQVTLLVLSQPRAFSPLNYFHASTELPFLLDFIRSDSCAFFESLPAVISLRIPQTQGSSCPVIMYSLDGAHFAHPVVQLFPCLSSLQSLSRTIASV
jgi:hypothetical protein